MSERGSYSSAGWTIERLAWIQSSVAIIIKTTAVMAVMLAAADSPTRSRLREIFRFAIMA